MLDKITVWACGAACAFHCCCATNARAEPPSRRENAKSGMGGRIHAQRQRTHNNSRSVLEATSPLSLATHLAQRKRLSHVRLHPVRRADGHGGQRQAQPADHHGGEPQRLLLLLLRYRGSADGRQRGRRSSPQQLYCAFGRECCMLQGGREGGRVKHPKGKLAKQRARRKRG